MFYARSAVIMFIAVSMGLMESGAAEAASAGERFDKNFETSTVPGPKVPAIAASALKESRGSATVRMGYKKVELETLTVVPPGEGPFPLAVVSYGTPTRGGKEALRNLRIRQVLPIAKDFARRGYKAVVFARRGYAS